MSPKPAKPTGSKSSEKTKNLPKQALKADKATQVKGGSIRSLSVDGESTHVDHKGVI